ncbi:chitinase-like protein 4 [Leptopilina heterotoma]|uniref:chitinase-like protein 4 n=1 Tax=Leptopilina heterotoma TaxID=63436 RepID=UPI001CA9213C|nr:chitinase-like protein 4 [Leptopilina heterotoma]XP_043474282.1 chitinase-like protein 4 [Leptopilina heterotoma]
MLWFISTLAFLSIALSGANGEKKIVCYFGSWSVYRPSNGKFDIADIDPNLCTHLIYTFVGLSEDANIRVLDSWQDLADNYGKNGFGRLNALRQKNPNLKTLVAIGGWNEGSTKYSNVFRQSHLRTAFAENALKFVKKHGFNGLDLDWEYPNQRGGSAEDVNSFTMLLKELKNKFTPEGYLVSVAVAATASSAGKSYNIREMSKYVDFINVMAYDLRGSWDSSKRVGINAPFRSSSKEDQQLASWNIEAIVKYWLDQGASPEKIILGTAFYGRSFTLVDPNKHNVGDSFSGPGTAGKYTREAGMLGYNEICELQKNDGWTIAFDDEQKVPYSYGGNQWVGYDDVRSLEIKAEYVIKMGLGGAMLWSIETDDFKGICGEKYPLLKTLNNVLRKGSSMPTHPIISPETTTPTILPVTDESTITKPVEIPTTPAISDDICHTSGYVRDRMDCSKFYYCNYIGDRYQISGFQCPPGTLFDESLHVCNFEHLVSC